MSFPSWSSAVLIIVIVALFGSLLVNYYEISWLQSICDSNSPNIYRRNSPDTSSLEQGVSSSLATSGNKFKGEKLRSFDDSRRLFKKFHPQIASKHLRESTAYNCKFWSVVTTIFPPSQAIVRQSKLDGWCIVIVGDKKGPHSKDLTHVVDLPNVVFLDADRQIELSKQYPLIGLLPWNSFGRKNIGYMFAIAQGAEVVWDFDDDNMLKSDGPLLEISGLPAFNPHYYDLNFSVDLMRIVGQSPKLINPYPVMGSTSAAEGHNCWPRGFPLELIKSNITQVYEVEISSIVLSRIGIIQVLADHDPDVDAIYRLTQPVPFYFDIKIAKAGQFPLLIPHKSYTPYNAQATLHLYSSLWSLLLPITVHGRVADIWRSYIFQRLAQDLDSMVVFSSAVVEQNRNAHSYLADFDSEDHLYKRSLRLVEQLDEWKLAAESLPGRVEELWILLYEHGYIQSTDIELIQGWLLFLVDIGYRFPVIIA